MLLLITLTSLIFLTTLTNSHNCESQMYTNNNQCTQCTDLPTLSATLHYTYMSDTSFLSVLFIAPPAQPQGWVAWALNPTRARMASSQALIAFHDVNNGNMAVKTFNISSYRSVVEGPIAFDVKEMRAESSDGLMRIYATLKLPETMTEVNQVWQVGSEVVKGKPKKHSFAQENLNSIGKLKLK